MRALAVVAAALVLAGACTSDDAALNEPEAPSLEDRAAGDPQFAADLEAAERSLLTVDDLPAGWAVRPDVDDTGDPASEQRIATCAGYAVDDLYPGDSMPHAQSATFGSPTGEEVFATVRVTPSERDAVEALARLDDPSTLGCIADELQRFAEETAPSAGEESVGAVEVDDLSVAEIGDESVAARVVVAVPTEGPPVDLFLDVVTIRVGRGVAQARSFSAVDPFDLGELEDLARTVAERMTSEIP